MTWAIEVDPERLRAASAGDSDARQTVAEALVRPVFNLAVRFLYEPADAEDAAQEAIVRVVRGLPSFRGESSFSTWAYRVVVRSLLNSRRGRRETLTLDEGIEALDEGLARNSATPEDAVLVEEVKLSCTTALLVCLPRTQRLAYVLGEIVGLPGPEAAAVLDIAPTAFRQRLAAARRTVRGFFRSRCGLVDEKLPCRCDRQVEYCVDVGFIDPSALRFADRGAEHRHTTRALDEAFTEAAVFLSHPMYAPSDDFTDQVRERLARALHLDD